MKTDDMKKKIRYSDEPLGDVKVAKDSLPPPEELAFREETVKVALQLSRASAEFFKEGARKHHAPYQRMIRRLLDEYAGHHVH